MNKLKHRFTKWYIRKGYTFGYDFTDVPVMGDEYIKTPCRIPKAIWRCPFWVRPLLSLFSPPYLRGRSVGEGDCEGANKRHDRCREMIDFDGEVAAWR